MTQDMVWLGFGGQRHGPYSRAQVKLWMAEGRFGADTLGWYHGLAEWQPLQQLFPEVVSQGPLPPSMPPVAAGLRASGHAASGGVDFPRPPALRWGWLLLIYVVSLGLAGYVWPFLQSSWVRRIDPHNRSSAFFAGAFVCLVVAGVCGGVEAITHNFGLSLLAVLLELTYIVLWLYALYAMAASMRGYFQQRGVRLEIGGVSLFFFNVFYLQGQLRRLAVWHDTGVLSPKAPKAIFWWLLGVLPLVSLSMLAMLLWSARP